MFSLIKLFNECKHEKVSYLVKASYCPDCGEYIENKFYIVRCSCCHIKRKGILKGSEIFPQDLYCHNCGSNKFYLEEIPAPNFFELDYLIVKHEAKHFVQKRKTTQIWIEIPEEQPKVINRKLLTVNN